MTQVTGILIDEIGTVLANTTCAVVAIDQIVGQDGGGRVSRGSIVVTDGAGEFDADIKPGRYELVVEVSAPADANVKFRRIGRLTVLTSGPMTLEEALDRNAEPVTPNILQQAIEAKDAAEAAAVTAVSAAAGVAGKSYVTRAEFVSDAAYVSGVDTPPNGTIVTAGGLSYVRSAGATALPGLPGWVPFGDVTPEHFGAVGDLVADDYAALQASLDSVSEDGGIVVAARGYLVGTGLRTYSNVTIDMRGTGIIRRGFNNSATGRGLMAVTLPAAGRAQNIVVKNGTLDGNGEVFTESHNIFTGSSIDGLTCENVTFLNVVDFHAMDFEDTIGLRAIRCKFMGFANKSGTRGFSEAIQTDPGYSLSDGETISDWLIDGCYCGANPDNTDPDFGPWPSLVGNHSANHVDVVCKNIRVIGNHVVYASWGAVAPFAWDETVISGNTFEDCFRGVFIQQGTGTKAQGCVGMTISGNTFKGGANAIFIVDNNTAAPSEALHKSISISGNTFDGAETCVRATWVSGLTINANTAKNVVALLTIMPATKQDGVAVSGNTVDTASSTVIGLLGEAKTVAVVGNTARNMSGRFLHATGAADAALRGQIIVNSNTLVDCAGPNVIAVDSGASKDVQINSNMFATGDAGLSPSGAELVRCTVTGRAEVMDNYVSDALISKVMRVQSGGIFRGRCTGSPEGVITAGVGSQALRSDGGAGTSFYVKESGTGNTGWVAK